MELLTPRVTDNDERKHHDEIMNDAHVHEERADEGIFSMDLDDDNWTQACQTWLQSF